jgi:hypothetical protein
MLQEKGGLREGVVCKPTVLTPGDNVYARRKGNTVSVGAKFTNSISIIVSHKGHFDRETAVVTG